MTGGHPRPRPARRARVQRAMARRVQVRPGAIVVVVFAVAIAIGTLALMLPGMRAGPDRASLGEALFTSTSAVTVTGLAVVDTETGWTLGGQVVILVLIQAGGLGITTLGTLLVMAVSRRLGLRTRLLTQAETPWLALGDVRAVLRGILLVTALVEGIAALGLAARWWAAYGLSVPDALWHGLFHAVSAFNNAGFALYRTSLEPFADDPVILLIISAAIILGGLGFPVLFEVWTRRGRPWRGPGRWSLHTRLTIAWTIALIVIGWVLVSWYEWTNPATFGPHSTGWKVLNGFFASVSPRTAGFNSFDYGAAQDTTLLTTDALMFVGGGSASTAGGIKVTTFVVLALVVLAGVRGSRDVPVLDRRIPVATQRTAVSVTLIFVAAVAASTYLLLAVTPYDLSAALFEAVSALCTVGLSTGITPLLGGPAQLVLIVLMFAGRVGVVTMASAFMLRDRTTSYRLPEGRPIVG